MARVGQRSECRLLRASAHAYAYAARDMTSCTTDATRRTMQCLDAPTSCAKASTHQAARPAHHSPTPCHPAPTPHWSQSASHKTHHAHHATEPAQYPPVWSWWLCAYTATSDTGSCSGPTHCCWATRPASTRTINGSSPCGKHEHAGARMHSVTSQLGPSRGQEAGVRQQRGAHEGQRGAHACRARLLPPRRVPQNRSWFECGSASARGPRH